LRDLAVRLDSLATMIICIYRTRGLFKPSPFDIIRLRDQAICEIILLNPDEDLPTNPSLMAYYLETHAQLKT
jgi:hypothetical protein